MVINSGDIHYLMSLTDNMSYYCLIIDSDFLKDFGMDVEKTSFCENVTDSNGTAFFQKIITEMASQSGFSRYYFSRQFKSIMGMTVMKYVEFLRCRHAKELLISGISVTKAAQECGFSELSYLQRCLNGSMGCCLRR